MNLMKALIPSTILTLILSAVVGQPGLQASFLNLQAYGIGGGYTVYWSWTVFFVAMAINGCLTIARGGLAAEAG